MASMCIGLAMVVGCAEDGLSPREKPSGLADTVYGTPAPANAASSPVAGPTTAPVVTGEIQVAPPFRLTGPISVAIVQMGEVAPPESAIRAFQARPDLFAKVDAIAGKLSPDGRASTADMGDYRSAAARLGDDYVLVYGGTLDRQNVTTPLCLLNLTIVGAFVVPSEQMTIDGRAAGMLVDVRTGRMGFAITAEAKASTLQPGLTAPSVAGPLADAVRRELQEKLVAATTERLAAAQRSGSLTRPVRS